VVKLKDNGVKNERFPFKSLLIIAISLFFPAPKIKQIVKNILFHMRQQQGLGIFITPELKEKT